MLKFYIKGVLPNGTRAFAKITREIYIVDDLKVGMLIGSDILTLERIVIDFIIQSIKISSYRDIIILIDSYTRLEPIRRIVKSSIRITLPPRILLLVLVAYVGELLVD